MVGIIVSASASIFLAVFGLYTGAISKMVATMIKGLCRLFKIERRKEKTIKVSQEVKMLFPEIKKAKKSRENAEKVSGVSFLGISLIVMAIIGVVLNLTVINDKTISEKLSSILPFRVETIKVYWTSAMFALITGGISICASQWKKGKKYREAQSREKIAEAAKRELTEKELIDIINSKIEEKR